MLTKSLTPLGKIRAALFVVKTNLIHFVHSAPKAKRAFMAIQGETTR